MVAHKGSVDGELYKRLSQVETDVASLSAQFSTFSTDLNRRLDDQGKQIADDLKSLRDDFRSGRTPVPWVPIAALVLGVLGASGTYIETRVRPLETTQYANTLRLGAVETYRAENEFNLGYMKGWQESIRDRVDRIEGLGDNVVGRSFGEHLSTK